MSQLPTGLSAAYWRTWHPPRSGWSVAESLDPGEEWSGSWDGVGLYEGNKKIPSYQSLTVHLTTDRLILLPDAVSAFPSTSTAQAAPAIQAHLSNVRQTEFYTGFMRSSSKITVFLGRPLDSPSPGLPDGGEEGQNWTCGVCGFVNPLPLWSTGPPSEGAKCGLCGVGYSADRAAPSSATRITTPSPTPPIPAPPPQPNGEGRIPCPACTFLNHRSLPLCEICSTPLSGATQSSSPISGTRPSPGAPGIMEGAGSGRMVPTVNGLKEVDVIRLSFRRGGEKECYRRLKHVLGVKSWERNGFQKPPSQPGPGGVDSSTLNGHSTPRLGAGIDGIMQSINLNAQAQSEGMQDAFKDLEVLMGRAGEMVRLAQSLNAKLTAQQNASGVPNPSDQEATLIRTSLVQLGLPAPALTQDMVRDNNAYHQGLAKELGSLLVGRNGQPGLMIGDGARGVIGLDEVWGLWMRARGIALVPPSTLLAVLPYISTSTNPSIRALALPSSLTVLHTPMYDPPNILSRVLLRFVSTVTADRTIESAASEPSLSLLEFSAHEGLPIGLAKEFLEQVERTSLPASAAAPGQPLGIVRDDQAGQGSGGIRWYRDIISTCAA